MADYGAGSTNMTSAHKSADCTEWLRQKLTEIEFLELKKLL